MRARSIKIAILLATICIVARPEAQAAAVVSGKYSITSWTDQDGLPLSQIWALTQTRDGFLWLATTAGRVTELLEDRSGMVWVGAPGGLFRFRDNRWESVGAVGAVTKLYEDRQGNLLILSLIHI